MAGLLTSAQLKLTPVDAGSKVHFVIRNFGISNAGDLSGLKGHVLFDKNNLAGSYFDVSVNVASINTDNKKRDNHLRSDDFFDVNRYPTIRITGKPIAANGSSYILVGTLTIKDVTKKIQIPFTVKPQAAGFLFQGQFSINRLDYHVGGESMILSDDLTVSLQVMAQ
jgi:polyisoprenoid-binding protein YceI